MNRGLIIGFDRRVRIEWLDAIASRQAAGASLAELRRFGHALLRREYPRDEARRKTLGVLVHLWVRVPQKAAGLRDTAGRMLGEVNASQRIALHWGLGVATYPFFRDLADAAGRLIALQGDVSLAQLQRRLAERWGQRATAQRAARRILRSWVDWGVLRESGRPGVYIRGDSIKVTGSLASWLVEALLLGSDNGSEAVSKLKRSPALFPFEVHTSLYELRRSPRLAVHRQGLDEDVVMWHETEKQQGGNDAKKVIQSTL
jgi:hypothetical protein